MVSRNIIVMPESLSMDDMKLLSGPICKAKGVESIGDLVHHLLVDLLEDYDKGSSKEQA